MYFVLVPRTLEIYALIFNCKTKYVSFLDACQVICAVILMAKEGTLKKVFKEWTLIESLTASGLPAAIYALQNSLLQISYKNLDSLTFSMLNQTKIFFTALFTYILLRYLLNVHLFLLVLSQQNFPSSIMIHKCLST